MGQPNDLLWGGQSYLGVLNYFSIISLFEVMYLNFLHSYWTCWFLFKEHLGESQTELLV